VRLMRRERPGRPLSGRSPIALGLLLLLGARSAAAQVPPPAGPDPRDPGAGAQAAPHGQPAVITPPVLRSRVEATYPPAALRDRLEATVGLEVIVGEDGHVVRARVTTASGHGFDEAAVEAVQRFTFEPARKDGVALPSRVQLAYEFHLPAPAAVLPDPPPPPPPPPSAPPATPVQQGPDQSTLVLAPPPLGGSIVQPQHTAASDSSTDQGELALRPRLRAEGVLEVVPGLFSVQHAGGGKAQQYFMRGFDLDHGTDLAFFVDGAPINAVSHAHGQGYSDLHFIIPETIDALESTKGPYSARVGDFATAGSATFHMADHVDESFGKVELGPDGHKRAVAVESPDLGESWRMLAAAEVFNENGPFIHPEDYNRFNGYLKVTRVLDDRSEVSLLLTAYGGSWNMSGVLPARAVCGEGDGTPTPAAYAGSRCLSRWDSVDPSQGGAGQRVMALASYRRRIEHGDAEATLYAVHSNLQLFPNDGIAASFQPAGIQYGSQVEQDDTRTETGATMRVTKRLDLAGIEVRSTYGLQFRDDAIESQLHRTEQRRRLDGMPGIPGPIVDSAINETQIGAYAEEDVRPARWVRFVLGGRADRIDAAVDNESPTAIDQVSGYKGATQFSPKASAIVYPLKEVDLFANYGRGFHSNDARTLIEGTATTLLATAIGYEVGTTVRPVKGLSVSAVAFLLDITSELTIDGDTASTTPSGPTRRYGGELSLRYDFRKEIYADAALTIAHARYTDTAPGEPDAPPAARCTNVETCSGPYVTLAPVRTFSAGIGMRKPFGPVTVIGGAYVRSMSDRPATQDGSLVATGFTLVNLEAGLRWRFLEVGADLLNVGDVAWREGQFAVNSRLPSEGPNPPAGISFTPGNPRELIAHAIAYW
jgi:TonB family protein